MLKPLFDIKRNSIIDNELRRTKDIVYGARAMNVQLPPGLQRQTDDYDIYAKRPKKKAAQLERALDHASGGNNFYLKPAVHKGTWKVYDKGYDGRKGTYDDRNVADFTKPERKIRSVPIMGIRYAHLDERRKDALRSLRQKEYEYRHQKDRDDLLRIKIGKKLRRW